MKMDKNMDETLICTVLYLWAKPHRYSSGAHKSKCFATIKTRSSALI